MKRHARLAMIFLGFGCGPNSGSVDSADSSSGEESSSSTSSADTDEPGTTRGGSADTAAETTGSTTMTTAASASVGDESSSGDEVEPCAVDILFVVDNSGSMGQKQGRLVQSLPGFFDRLGEYVSTRVLVTDVDASVWGTCAQQCEDAQAQGCLLEDGTCDSANPDCSFLCQTSLLGCTAQGYECGQPTAQCEDVLGAGVTHPIGERASNESCGFPDGQRYIDDDAPEFADIVACAAQVGTGSLADPERPLEAMVEALDPSSEAADCNAGFLRDEAQLLVVLLTDEDDDEGDGSAGNALGWYSAVLDAKAGDEGSVAVLGIIGDTAQPNSVCGPPSDSGAGAEDSPRIRAFLSMFGERARAGSICEDSYADDLEWAADLVSTSCAGR